MVNAKLVRLDPFESIKVDVTCASTKPRVSQEINVLLPGAIALAKSASALGIDFLGDLVARFVSRGLLLGLFGSFALFSQFVIFSLLALSKLITLVIGATVVVARSTVMVAVSTAVVSGSTAVVGGSTAVVAGFWGSGEETILFLS